jgi:hypothetical protein
LVAYASRCARRVQPLLRHSNSSYRDTIDQAILLAENFARGGVWKLPYNEPEKSIKRYFRVLTSANAADSVAEVAAYAAYYALQVAASVAAIDPERAKKGAYLAYCACLGKIEEDEDARFDASGIDVAIAADGKKLDDLSLGSYSELGSPVDPSEDGPFGLLWPSGAPAFLMPYLDDQGTAVPGGHGTSDSELERLHLEAEVDEFVDTEEVADALANLCYALNAYHIAAGGNGLAIDEWEVLVPKSIPVGAR